MVDDIVRILDVITPILWTLIGFAALFWFKETIKEFVLPRLSGVKAMGVEISFIEDSIDTAIEVAEKTAGRPVIVPDDEKSRAVKQAMRHAHAFQGKRILWVDDIPSNNRNERKMFRGLGVEFDNAVSTSDALSLLDLDDYDCVISDMKRDEGQGDNIRAGLEFIELLRQTGDATPVVFYIGEEPIGIAPASSAGITHRPDKLLSLVLAALQGRTRGGRR